MINEEFVKRILEPSDKALKDLRDKALEYVTEELGNKSE